jgi:hypothetical protein
MARNNMPILRITSIISNQCVAILIRFIPTKNDPEIGQVCRSVDGLWIKTILCGSTTYGAHEQGVLRSNASIQIGSQMDRKMSKCTFPKGHGGTNLAQ